MTFLEELQKQRWDDHRYYHHNRINQFLHLISAMCFVISYVMVFYNITAAVLIGWLLSMVLRQSGHFFFEPLTYDTINKASHEYKESIKVGYNLKRKVVLLSLWGLAPLVLWWQPSFFGLLTPYTGFSAYVDSVALLWLVIGIGAVLLRSLHLCKLMGGQSAVVWATKILTDPFHDIKVYYKSPYYLMKGEMYDDMTQWYDDLPLKNA